MENRLSEAARTGNVGALQNLLRENPLILADFALTSPYESPLHTATKAGKLQFVQEIIRHRPEFATDSNQEGFRPMDIASAFGYVEIVTELLGTDSKSCCLAGRDGRTALHYAAINDRLMVIDELISTCKESIKDVTTLGETALHLAVKNCKFDAFKGLIKWLEHLGMEELVNWPDRDGNTVLHISVSRKQLECVEVLLSSSNIISSSLELNAMNSRGLTAMDILDIVTEGPGDIRLREILQSAGALKACNIINGTSPAPPSLQQLTSNNNNRTNSENLFEYFRFQQQRDSPSDVRNTLLVVAALIATVTFDAALNPPSFLQTTEQVKSTTTSPGLASLPPTSPTGTPSSNWALFVFMFVNTVGFMASAQIITSLTSGFPFYRELLTGLHSMTFLYGVANGSSSKDFHLPGGIDNLIYISFFVPFLVGKLPIWAKGAWNKYWAKPSSSRDPVVQAY